MKRRRRRAPATTLRSSLGRRMREKDEWGGSPSSFDYDKFGDEEPFFLLSLLQRMHRYLLIKAVVAVAAVLAASLLLSGGNNTWGRPVVEALQFAVSWEMDVESMTGRAIPAFRTVWNIISPGGDYGEDAADMVILPVDGRLISGFGLRTDPESSREEMHYGIDLAAAEGAPVFAVLDGTVLEVIESSGAATVILTHGDGWQTLYRGLREAQVKKGDVVEQGFQLGSLGTATCWSTPHLHFELRWEGRPVAPAEQWLEHYRDPAI